MPARWKQRQPVAKKPVDLIQVYQCFCDQTRLRLLDLLRQGPVCVCHFQEILGEPQVKISKHLAYLRARRAVVTRRCGNWMIYSLARTSGRELGNNLECLQELVRTDPVFRRDRKRLSALRSNNCGPAAVFPSHRRG